MQQCVKVGDGVFISASNVSCSDVETPSCPLGTELRCYTQDCCPRCHCGKHTHTFTRRVHQRTQTFSLEVLHYSTSRGHINTFQCQLSWDNPDQVWCIIKHCEVNVRTVIHAFLPCSSSGCLCPEQYRDRSKKCRKEPSFAFILDNLNGALYAMCVCPGRGKAYGGCVHTLWVCGGEGCREKIQTILQTHELSHMPHGNYYTI